MKQDQHQKVIDEKHFKIKSLDEHICQLNKDIFNCNLQIRNLEVKNLKFYFFTINSVLNSLESHQIEQIEL
jgi:hypothetical protein